MKAWHCPRCGKRFKTWQGVVDHSRDFHGIRIRTRSEPPQLDQNESDAEWANSQMTVGEEQDWGA